jgi:hypothetical protein
MAGVALDTFLCGTGTASRAVRLGYRCQLSVDLAEICAGNSPKIRSVLVLGLHYAHWLMQPNGERGAGCDINNCTRGVPIPIALARPAQARPSGSTLFAPGRSYMTYDIGSCQANAPPRCSRTSGDYFRPIPTGPFPKGSRSPPSLSLSPPALLHQTSHIKVRRHWWRRWRQECRCCPYASRRYHLWVVPR